MNFGRSSFPYGGALHCPSARHPWCKAVSEQVKPFHLPYRSPHQHAGNACVGRQVKEEKDSRKSVVCGNERGLCGCFKALPLG